MAKDRMDAPKDGGVDTDSIRRWLRDSTDLNNEYAGRETGRMRRFLGRDQYEQLTEQEKKDRAYNALMRLLLDPDYAKAYFRAEDAITRVEDAIAKARRDLDEQAGQMAGRTQDEIEAQRREIERFERETLAPIRERLDDPDNPFTEKELTGIPAEIERALPPILQKHYEAEAHLPEMPISSLDSAADQYEGPTDLGGPDLRPDFKAAHDGPGGKTALAAAPAFAPKAS